MAKTLYTEGAQKIFEAVFNWVGDNYDALLLPSSYAFDATDVFISDLGTITKRVALASKTNVDGVLDAADVTFAAVAAGSTVGSLVIAKNTGSDATSPLLLHDSAVLGLPYATTGGDITLKWNDGAAKIIKMLTTVS